MTLRYRLTLWWLGLDNLDRVSVICSAVLAGVVLAWVVFLLGVF